MDDPLFLLIFHLFSLSLKLSLYRYDTEKKGRQILNREK
ncbi:hypothetical protein GLYMA_12G103750v4 [Glycine max]|nr:hypothetical protein GLYMA_12G103750v4 [Glycine max]KAH1142543.1 hypothetical protein GYH30_033302 [Glycine max]